MPISTDSVKVCAKGHEYPASNPYCCYDECLQYAVLGCEQAAQGVLTYVEGFKYPLLGFPAKERLDATAATKRAFIATLRRDLKNPFFFLNVLRRRKVLLREIKDWVEDIYVADYEKKCLPLEQFSPSSREFIRVLTSQFGEEKWIYCLVMIYDTDLAYRYRVQDILGELDQEKLLDNPRKEIRRLFGVIEEREINPDVMKKWRMMRILINAVFLLSPMTVRAITDFLLDLDLEKIRMNINDRYWVANRFDYNYEGLTYEQRIAWKNEEDANWNKPQVERTQTMPQIVINPPNEEFYRLTPEEAEDFTERTKQALLENYRQRNNLQPA